MGGAHGKGPGQGWIYWSKQILSLRALHLNGTQPGSNLLISFGEIGKRKIFWYFKYKGLSPLSSVSPTPSWGCSPQAGLCSARCWLGLGIWLRASWVGDMLNLPSEGRVHGCDSQSFPCLDELLLAILVVGMSSRNIPASCYAESSGKWQKGVGQDTVSDMNASLGPWQRAHG